LKILYFSRDYTTHDHRFLFGLAQTDHRIYYLRLENRGHGLEDRPVPAEVEQVQWEGGTKKFRWQAGPALWISLKKVIRQVKPDLVHAGPLQGPALLVSLSGFKPLVSMSWGYDLLLDPDRSFLRRWAARYTLSRSAVLVGDCEAVRKKAVEFGMPVERIVTFPWGVDLHHFSPAETCQEEGKPPKPGVFTLLSTRSWEPVYGVDLIARAFVKAARILEEQGKCRLRLIMLGTGSMSPELRKIFAQAGVQERVHFPGQVSWANLPKFYRAAGLYLSASHVDGSSVSLLEAMACACPVLVSDIPGNREWVKPGEEGWWFRDGEVDDLCRGILRAVDERHRLKEMGMTARRTVEARANWNQNFGKLLEAYQMAMNLR
jgi:L-malate glycosyltransferase